MRNTLRLTTGAAVLGVVTLAGAPAALAQAACSSYSNGCDNAGVLPDSETRGAVAPATVSRSSSTGSGVGSTGAPSSLPFTGTETAAIALAGAGALAAGTALVVASRRRTAAA